MTLRSEGEELCPRVTCLADRTGHVCRSRSCYGSGVWLTGWKSPHTLASCALDPLPLLTHGSGPAGSTSNTSTSRTRLGRGLRAALVLASDPTQTAPPSGCPRGPPLEHQPRPQDCRLTQPLKPLAQTRPTSPYPSQARPGQERSCVPLSVLTRRTAGVGSGRDL